VVIATTAFAALARAVAQRAELPEARIAVVEHPLGGISEDAVLARAAQAVDEVVALFTERSR
jgi:hypothetical protein